MNFRRFQRVSIAGCLALAACASAPKTSADRIAAMDDHDDSLLGRDASTGWSKPKGLQKTVGEFDLIYSAEEEQPSSAAENCSYSESGERTIVICEKGRKASRGRLKAERLPNTSI